MQVQLEDKGIVESLKHPGCVWDAEFLETGDIVTACSDGVARVWTARDGMIADQTEIDDFDTQLSETKRVKKGFAFFKDAENCPLPKHQIRIESFVKRINMALKLENGNNELSPQHMYILGHPDLFTDPDRSYLEKQHFTFFDTAWRNRQCTFTDSDGNLCGNDVGEQHPETTMIELLQTRTRHPDCPKNVLVISADRDFNMRQSIYKRRKEGKIDGGGLLTKVSHGEWKAQEGAFTRGLSEVEEEAIMLIGREEGVKGYWKGNLPQVIRIVPYSAVQLFAYEAYKAIILFWGEDGQLSVLGAAGMTSTVITYPLDVLRLRLAVEPGWVSNHVPAQVVMSHVGSLEHASLYNGLGPWLLSIAPYIGLNFCVFDLVKKSLPERNIKKKTQSQQW
ncbi:hypothetical protein Bca52824_004780 [Brassica carinata]|uniref:Uncharacterized protein n=1 Tax=Brassica carinata TaxID=52824 RepID=A0A8X7WR50_BRACI|nr:hypothetical protein Bca52824_004780 [Brassica carinata]